MKYKFHIYTLIILLLILSACKPEKFDTLISIKLISGISKLTVNPCKVVIKFNELKNGIVGGFAIIDTITTDSFGNANKIVKLGKLKKNQYYTAEVIESKWQGPVDEERKIIPEIENTVGFSIKPKWRRGITLEDSAGRLQMDEYECYNSLTKTYKEFQSFDSLKKFNQQFLYASAPQYSHIFIKLRLHNRNTKELKIIEKVYDTEKYPNIWLKY